MSISVKISGSVRGLKNALNDGVASVKSFGAKVSGALKGANAALGALGIGFAFKSLVDELDNLSKRSRSLGLTAEELQGIEYAARSANAPVDSIVSGIGRIADVIAEARNGNKQATDSLLKLGLTAESFAGKSTYEAFRLIVDSINDIPDAMDRASTAMDFFGKSITKNMAFLDDFRDNIENFKASGAVISDDAVKNAEKFNQMLTDMVQHIKAIVTKLPGIQEMMNRIEWAAKFAENAPKTWREFGQRILGNNGVPRKMEGELGYAPEREAARNRIFERTGVWETDDSERLKREIAAGRQKEAEARKAAADLVRQQAAEAAKKAAEEKAKADAEKAAKADAAKAAKASPVKEAIQRVVDMGGTEVSATSLARVGGGFGVLSSYQSTMQKSVKAVAQAAEKNASALQDIKTNGVTLRA